MGASVQEYINRYGRRPGTTQPVTVSLNNFNPTTTSAAVAGGGAVKIEGLEQFKARLLALSQTLRRRVLINSLRAGAREIRDTAKRNAPVLSGRNLSSPYRKPGTVRDAISVRTSKVARQRGDLGVFVNVKPLPGNKWRKDGYTTWTGGSARRYVLVKKTDRGSRNPNDPYYWRFIEFGTSRITAQPFLRPAAERLPQALKIIESSIGTWLQKVERSGDPNAT